MDLETSTTAPIVLAGPFQPQAIAELLPAEAAAQLDGLYNFAGIPIVLLTQAYVARSIQTTLIGGVRGAEPRFIKGKPLSVVIYRSSGGWPFVLNGRRSERAEILRHLGALRPRIVHAHWTLEAGRAVADWTGPKVLTVQDAAWEYMRLGWTPRPISTVYGLRWLANTSATLKRFRHVIAISPYTETYLRLTAKFRGEIRVIPNIIPPLPVDIHIREGFPKSGVVTFACYGDPGPLKNIATAIKAFRILSQSMSDLRLLVFGPGWDKLKDELSGDGIEFRGGLPHGQFLRTLAMEVDFWVHPSRIETQGIVFCEAIQAGCPVVAGHRSGAVPWVLDYGRAGLLVDVENPDALAEGMRFLVLDRKGAVEQMEYGRHFIRENFNAERIVDLHLKYYEDICWGETILPPKSNT